MRVLSNPDKAGELIEQLCQTTFSPESFAAAHELCNNIDLSRAISRDYKYWKGRLRELVKKEAKVSLPIRDPVHSSNENTNLDFDNVKNISVAAQVARAAKIIKDIVDNLDTLSAELEETIKQFMLLYRAILGDGVEYSVTPAEWNGHPASEIEIAAAVYVMYAQSRDGMGEAFSPEKYRSQDAYYKRINRLYDVADRMNGVEVWNTQAVLFGIDPTQLGLFSGVHTDVGLFQDPGVMAYLDPPYLAKRDLDPLKDLGAAYRFRMDATAHEQLLKQVVKAHCKVLISNYDNDLYNDYLHDWTRIDIPVKTSVGGKVNNQRVEVLWYNY